MISTALFLAMASLTFFAWRQQVEYQHSLLSRHTEDVCAQASRRLEVFMESHLRVANIFARRWSTHESRDFSRQRFERFALVLIEELPGFHAVRLIQTSQDHGWVIPRSIQIPKSLLDPEHRQALEEALQNGLIVLSAPFEADPGNASIYVALPLQREEEFLGYLVVDFLLETLVILRT
ncbi:MAG: hypothetical protein GTN72_11290 [Candidatus Latescibacteria bacterium]|nr:hypothetical protein [Candidatus Latescibacterota bacterium]